MVRKSGHQDYCFYRDAPQAEAQLSSKPQRMMRVVQDAIATCDALLIDVTDKPTGRAVEAGIAYALGKKVFFSS